MATIVSIIPMKRNSRFRIIFDENFSLVVSRETLLKFQLKEGQIFSLEEIYALKQSDELTKIKESAFRYLKIRSHSSRELQTKLKKKGFDTKTVLRFIQQIQEEGLINDREFLFSFIQQRIHHGKKSRLLIAEELRQKGFADHQIRQALDECYPEELELENARKICQSRWQFYRDKPVNERKWKVYQVLQQRGFGSSIIRKVLEPYLSDDEKNQLES